MAVFTLLLLQWMLGLAIAVLLVFLIRDYSIRNRKPTAMAFNSILRTVCHRDGAITKVAVAFSRSGPLSGRFYEYARRLMMGQDPIEAAARARIPLHLSTAVAMQTPVPAKQFRGRDEDEPWDGSEVGREGWTHAYGQIIYLLLTTVVVCLLLALLNVKIAPGLNSISSEFGYLDVADQLWFSAWPAVLLLFALLVIVGLVMPRMSRGYLFGICYPSWVPVTPSFAQHKSEVLYGLADAIDAGWPIGRALAVGHTISIDPDERHSLERAMELIEQGRTPIDAVCCTGWIDQQESLWLDGASPQRTAELLRMIGDQGIRDAQANVRWIMSIFFPLFLLLLAGVILASSYEFYRVLYHMVLSEVPA